MTTNSKNIPDVMAQMQAVKADDPDMIDKLNQIARGVALAQGKSHTKSKDNINVVSDPMDELGCEGCQ